MLENMLWVFNVMEGEMADRDVLFEWPFWPE